MLKVAKAVVGTLMLAGTAMAVTAPASAGFSIGFGVGPAWVPPPQRYYGPAICDPYSRYYDPYYCSDYDYYYGPPLYIGGYWYDRPLRSRWYGGHREFWVNNSWYRNDGWNRGGFYRNYGGWGRGGSYGGSYGGGHGGSSYYGGSYGGGHGGSYGGGHGGSYGGGHGGGYGGGHGGHH
jgi:hypothetical protein